MKNGHIKCMDKAGEYVADPDLPGTTAYFHECDVLCGKSN